MARLGAYVAILIGIFRKHYQAGIEAFEFDRTEIGEVAKLIDVAAPKNYGDLIYAFRFRRVMPKEISDTAPYGLEWIIENAGISTYRFQLSEINRIIPRSDLLRIKIPNCTPEIISKYALTDEQSLLAKVRYNRLIDIFLGITAYSLQNHLRTTVISIGQIEIDEIYVGVNRHGAHFVIPVQAKAGSDQLGIVQTKQDIKCCEEKFPNLICRPISTQFLDNDIIAMFEMILDGNQIRVVNEKHYSLVLRDEITNEDLQRYNLYQE